MSGFSLARGPAGSCGARALNADASCGAPFVMLAVPKLEPRPKSKVPRPSRKKSRFSDTRANRVKFTGA